MNLLADREILDCADDSHVRRERRKLKLFSTVYRHCSAILRQRTSAVASHSWRYHYILGIRKVVYISRAVSVTTGILYNSLLEIQS